jgi:hypothetical protein
VHQEFPDVVQFPSFGIGKWCSVKQIPKRVKECAVEPEK